MQDPRTMNMEPISEKLHDEINALQEGEFVTSEMFKDGTPIPAGTVTFRVGEEVKIKGSLFRVHRIKKKDIVLRRATPR